MAPSKRRNLAEGGNRINMNRAQLNREDRQSDTVPIIPNHPRCNHARAMRSLYITFNPEDHRPVTLQHIQRHFYRNHPNARVAHVKLQKTTLDRPRSLCAWVEFEAANDMVEVLGPALMPKPDFSELHQSLYIVPQTCLCPDCEPRTTE